MGAKQQKLGPEDIDEIRRRRLLGETNQSIANSYGVTRAHISALTKGILPRYQMGSTGRARPGAVITDADAKLMRELRALGATYTSIAARFGTDPSYVMLICRGLRHPSAGGPTSSSPEAHRKEVLAQRMRGGTVGDAWDPDLEDEYYDASED